MLRKALAAAVAILALPVATSAQTIGIGLRAGTFGFGGDVSVGVMNNLAVRGGIGVFPFEFNGDVGEVNYNVNPTSPLTHVGIDFFPGLGGLHLSGGVLLIPNTTDLTGEYTGTVNVGGRTYTRDQVGSLTGALDHGSSAPFLAFGFGRRTPHGFAAILDIGAAFLSEQRLTLQASGPAASNQQFRDDLERERQSAEEKLRRYLQVLPVFSIGLRFGL